MLPARAVFPEWEDWPQRAQRSQSLKTPEQNGDMFQAPSPARLRVPARTGKRSATEGSEIPEFEDAGQERGHVPSAAPARLRVPVRFGKRLATESTQISEFEDVRAERGHVPSAAPARLRVPVATGGQPRGAAPTLQGGSAMRSPEGATWNGPGFSREIGGAPGVSPVRDERK